MVPGCRRPLVGGGVKARGGLGARTHARRKKLPGRRGVAGLSGWGLVGVFGLAGSWSGVGGELEGRAPVPLPAENSG